MYMEQQTGKQFIDDEVIWYLEGRHQGAYLYKDFMDNGVIPGTEGVQVKGDIPLHEL